MKKKVPMKSVKIYENPRKGELLYDFTLSESDDDDDSIHFKEGSFLVVLGEYMKLVRRSYLRQYICLFPDIGEVTSIYEAHIELEESA